MIACQFLIATAPAGSAIKVFDPQSPQARAIFHLGITAGVIFAFIFAIVAGMILFALMRYRWREGEPDPKQVAGNRMVELVWTVVPCLIVVALFILTERTMGVADPPPAPAPDLIVTGHQWWWEARYPKSGVVTANEIHIPVGNPLSVQLESADVLHEFWVPELARKMTTVPGSSKLHLAASRTSRGPYLGSLLGILRNAACLDAFPDRGRAAGTNFDAWEKAQLAPAAASAGRHAARGLALFQQMSCMECHAINGTTAKARVGPDLTHFASRRQLGAGIAENTPENLRRWLADPQEVKPGVKMPNFNLTDRPGQRVGRLPRDVEMNELTSVLDRAGLLTVRSSGSTGRWRGSPRSITSASAFSTW